MKGNKSTITEILPLKSGICIGSPYRGSGQFFLEDGKELLLRLVPLPRCWGAGGGEVKKRRRSFQFFFFRNILPCHTLYHINTYPRLEKEACFVIQLVTDISELVYI